MSAEVTRDNLSLSSENIRAGRKVADKFGTKFITSFLFTFVSESHLLAYYIYNEGLLSVCKVN